MKSWKRKLLPFIDFLLVPFVYPSAWLLKNVRALGIQNVPRSKNALFNVGIYPIRDHFYEPQFNMRNARRPFSEERNLPGINWNTQEQLDLLEQLTFAEELEGISTHKTDDLHYYLNNPWFGPGDAEYLYQLIRLKKPKRIFEVGSGNSTLMAIKAIHKNQEENPDYRCQHICIEPYKMPWLEKTGVSVLRKVVEDIDVAYFLDLEEDDILFIDSSHMIRPDGDVLFLYLELLPSLNKGVIVHLHDIFSPKNYPDDWLNHRIKFWNEQYLLEAFLAHNHDWKIIGSLNHLHHNHGEKLQLVCPLLPPDKEPGSFYIQKIA